MENCPYTQDHIKRYLENALTHSEQKALQEHIVTCPACAKAYAQMNLLEKVVKEANAPETDRQKAATRIMERLAEHQAAPTQRFPGWIRQCPRAVALLLIGVGLGMMCQTYWQKSASLADRLPVAVEVAEVKGTVLVKHQDTPVWHVLKPNSPIYLGDTFYSTATSDFVLALDHTNRIEVTQNSLLVLESYDNETQFYLEHGQCTPVLDGPHGPFFIRTPNGRMEALGTRFTVKVIE